MCGSTFGVATMLRLYYDVAVGVSTLEVVSLMLQPCFDVMIENMSRHISEMVSRQEICCGCLIVVATDVVS